MRQRGGLFDVVHPFFQSFDRSQQTPSRSFAAIGAHIWIRQQSGGAVMAQRRLRRESRQFRELAGGAHQEPRGKKHHQQSNTTQSASDHQREAARTSRRFHLGV